MSQALQPTEISLGEHPSDADSDDRAAAIGIGRTVLACMALWLAAFTLILCW